MVLAVPWQAVREIVPNLALPGRILIDATNPYLDDGYDGGEATWSARDFGDVRPAVFVCGDDAEARSVVAGLASEIGYDPHDIGGLRHARWLETVTRLVVALGDSAVALTVTRIGPG